MCFEFRAGWAQCRLFALERPLVNSFLPGLKASSPERERQLELGMVASLGRPPDMMVMDWSDLIFC